MPYVQSATVAGMTTPEIEQMIVGKLRQGYLRDPQVSVQAVALRPFYILGEVTAGGSYAYQPGLLCSRQLRLPAALDHAVTNPPFC